MNGVHRSRTDFQFLVIPSRSIKVLQGSLASMLLLGVSIGPFTVLSKIAFAILTLVLSVHYWRKSTIAGDFSQLRYQNDNLLLVFNSSREPEIIYLIGQQRILPWLVELRLQREDGRIQRWGITYDAMDADSFRRLKVFLQTHHQKIIR